MLDCEDDKFLEFAENVGHFVALLYNIDQGIKDLNKQKSEVYKAARLRGLDATALRELANKARQDKEVTFKAHANRVRYTKAFDLLQANLIEKLQKEETENNAP